MIRSFIICLAALAVFVDHLFVKLILILAALILFIIKNHKNKTALNYFVFVLGLGVIGALVIENTVFAL